jgi:O-antigen ligase
MHTSMALMEISSWSLFVGALVYVILGGQKILGGQESRLDFPLWRAFVLLTASVIASLFATEQLKPWFPQLGFMRWIFLFYGHYWALRAVWSENFDGKVAKLWAALVLLTGVYAVFQALTGMDPVHLGKSVVNPQGPGLWKATAFFSMSLSFAYVIGTSTFAISGRARQLPSRALGLGGLLFGCLGILASMSRGAWIGFVISGMVWIGFNARRWLLWFVVFLMLLLNLLIFYFEGFARKIAGLLTFEMDHSSFVRVELWRSYWEMFKDHPFFGVGLLEGDKYLPEYYSRLGFNEKFTSHAHNVFLQWLAGAGPVAFLTYLYISFVMLKKAYELRDVTSWGWSLFLAQLYFHFGGLTEANFFDGEVNHMIVFIWALTWVLNKRFVHVSV